VDLNIRALNLNLVPSGGGFLIGDFEIDVNELQLEMDIGYRRVFAVYERVGDTIPPAITEITQSAPTQIPGEAVFDVIFSEDISGVLPEQFSVNGGPFGTRILGITGTGAIRRVRVFTGGIDGPLSLSFRSDGDVLDRAGNSIEGPGDDKAFETLFDAILRLATLRMVEQTTEAVRLHIEANGLQTYRIDYSKNLIDWHPLTEVTLANEEIEVDDIPMVPGEPRFYRAAFR